MRAAPPRLSRCLWWAVAQTLVLFSVVVMATMLGSGDLPQTDRVWTFSEVR